MKARSRKACILYHGPGLLPCEKGACSEDKQVGEKEINVVDEGRSKAAHKKSTRKCVQTLAT